VAVAPAALAVVSGGEAPPALAAAPEPPPAVAVAPAALAVAGTTALHGERFARPPGDGAERGWLRWRGVTVGSPATPTAAATPAAATFEAAGTGGTT